MKIFLVGGAVRDDLLGFEVKDKDWVVVGSNEQEMINLGYKQVGGDFPVFLHPDTKEEYALARTERKSGTGHKGFEFNTTSNVTLEDDLKRRDLTINAIAKSAEGNLIDPFKGEEDLNRKILRKVSESFKEDPLRVLRVARFAAKLKHLEFYIDKGTMLEMKSISSSGELKTLPKERIWQETRKALEENNPEEYFKVLIESGFDQASNNLSKINFDLLKSISSHVHQYDLRWVSLVANPELNIEDLNQVFGVPKKTRDLTIVSSRLMKFDQSSLTDIKSSEILNLLLKLDALRREERFTKALKVLKVSRLFSDNKEVIPWDNIARKLRKVKPLSKAKEKNEIIKDIREQSLKIIESELK
tara:strand:+ start:378 stop:1454 length:1077 start_codon:yes stop_codon:yes gene_type:complete